MKRSIRKRLGAGLMALCVAMASPLSAAARTVGEIEEEQSRLEQENADLEAKLDQLRSDEADKQAYQQALQDKINFVQSQIDSARQDITDLNANITALTLKLEKSQQEIQETIDQFKKRLVALYQAGNVTTLQILLDSNSFSDFTMRSELMKTMTDHDQQLMDKIEAYMESTQDERDECNRSKQKVAELKKNLENQQDELDGLYQENAAAIAELETAQANTQKLIEDNQEELERNDQEMQDLIQKQKEEEERRRQEALNQQQSGGEYLGDGDFSYPTGGGGVEGFNPIWPLPGVSYVSCYYGGYEGHRGMDIAGPYGTPVVAAESGTVIKANDYDSWGDSWGYYVLIYHNGTFTTRYAHLSSLAVGQGQYVEQGTVVGYEGATGNVTGPHLHFEVYENGSRVDPMNYL